MLFDGLMGGGGVHVCCVFDSWIFIIMQNSPGMQDLCAGQKRCRVQKEEKERTKGKESLWFEAPVRTIILQMHTPRAHPAHKSVLESALGCLPLAADIGQT